MHAQAANRYIDEVEEVRGSTEHNGGKRAFV